MPEERYAQMNNVWFIPSCRMLHRWLKRAGMKDIHIIDISVTTTEEQRSTEWMRFQSLSDFLNPLNPQQTIEGYPAPRRAVITAINPG
jgi:tRNA (mo5U34)-methyltransferase